MIFGSLRFAARCERAFTLVEMIISGVLMALILASAYLCLGAAFASQRLIDTRSDAMQVARVATGLIAADLRSAVPLSKEYELIGMHRSLDGDDADNLDFATRNYVPQKSYEPDYCEVSYFAQRDPATGTLTLFRRRDPTPDLEPFSGGTREEIARGLLGLRFEYYDGYDWYDEWGDPTGKKRLSAFPEPNVSGLPEAVRVTLTVDPSFERRGRDRAANNSGETPITFQTTARVNMSLFFYRSSGTGGSSSTNGAAQREVSPTAPPGGPQ